jgi:hypothetical protein
MLVYKENPKHKPGVFGEGPPRWFPDRDTLCPDDITAQTAQLLLSNSIEGGDVAHPNAKARYALDDTGRFFKGYSEATQDKTELWHGYEVAEEKVNRQVPARILKAFRDAGRLARPRYKKLLGGAS